MIPYEYEGEPRAYMPDFLVRLVDGRTVILETKGFEPDEDNEERWTHSVPGKYLNYAEIDGLCYGGLQPAEGLPFGLWGDVFLKAMYVIFDVKNERIGFAKKKL